MTTLTQVKPARKPRTIKPATGVCRLTLTINDTDYAVRPLSVDPASGVTRLVRLRKNQYDDGAEYHVSRHDDGHCQCTCADWIYSRDGRDPIGCKHVVSLSRLGLL